MVKIINLPGRWHKPKTPALGRQRQEDHEFEAILGYRVRLYLKTKKVKFMLYTFLP
jgi:hypothetical protein